MMKPAITRSVRLCCFAILSFCLFSCKKKPEPLTGSIQMTGLLFSSNGELHFLDKRTAVAYKVDGESKISEPAASTAILGIAGVEIIGKFHPSDIEGLTLLVEESKSSNFIEFDKDRRTSRFVSGLMDERQFRYQEGRFYEWLKDEWEPIDLSMVVPLNSKVVALMPRSGESSVLIAHQIEDQEGLVEEWMRHLIRFSLRQVSSELSASAVTKHTSLELLPDSLLRYHLTNAIHRSFRNNAQIEEAIKQANSFGELSKAILDHFEKENILLKRLMIRPLVNGTGIIQTEHGIFEVSEELTRSLTGSELHVSMLAASLADEKGNRQLVQVPFTTTELSESARFHGNWVPMAPDSVMQDTDMQETTITLDVVNERISIYNGCNTHVGRIKKGARSIEVTYLASFGGFCKGQGEWSKNLDAFLLNAKSFEKLNELLIVRTPEDSIIFRRSFQP